MPTGYTAQVEKGIDFKTFVLTCARAFGACARFRDEPLDTPLPDTIEPSDFYLTKKLKLEKELSRIRWLTTKNAEKEIETEYERALALYNTMLQEAVTRRKSYQDMLTEVQRWEAPTTEHAPLKKFMADQLTESMKFDCGEDYFVHNVPKKLCVHDWQNTKLEKLQKDVDYYTKEYEAEVARAAKSNAWLQQLHTSLPS